MTTTEAETSGGFVVGQRSIYVVGLEGEVTAHTDGTVTLCGFTLPTRLNREGGVKFLSTEWPADPEVRRRAEELEHENVEVAADNDRFTRETEMLLAAIGQLHDENHTGTRKLCLHEICRKFRI